MDFKTKIKLSSLEKKNLFIYFNFKYIWFGWNIMAIMFKYKHCHFEEEGADLFNLLKISVLVWLNETTQTRWFPWLQSLRRIEFYPCKNTCKLSVACKQTNLRENCFTNHQKFILPQKTWQNSTCLWNTTTYMYNVHMYYLK